MLENDLAQSPGRESIDVFRGYAAGAPEPVALGAYATMLGLFSLELSTILALASRRRSLRRGLRFPDIVLLGVATHKIARIGTKDAVTAPIRAPFVRFEESVGAGEVRETARGTGLRRVIGQLLTCPYCAAPWVASTLLGGLALAPRATRMIASLFATVAVADALQQLYTGLRKTIP